MQMQMTTTDLSAETSLAMDARGLNDLKRQVRADTPESRKSVAQQFEAMFLQVVLKAMRDATPHDSLFDSDQSRMYESMHDQQLTQSLATRGGGMGLAAMLEKQLARLHGDEVVALENLPFNPAQPALPLGQSASGIALPAGADKNAATEGGRRLLRPAAPGSIPGAASPASARDAAPAVSVAPGSNSGGGSPAPSAAAREFIERIWPYALEASRTTGIPPQFMVAHAVLETGWGKSEPRLPDGSPSHNLFGIKADRGWNGASVSATTTEVVSGLAQRQVARFRAYASYQEAFQDYAHFLASNPRYSEVLGARDAASFARSLQDAGYATDPQYSTKLARLMGGKTLNSIGMQG